MSPRGWTKEQIQTLRDQWALGTDLYTIGGMVGKSGSAVKSMAVKLKIYRPQKKADIQARAIRKMIMTREMQEAPPRITLAGPKWSWPEPRRAEA